MILSIIMMRLFFIFSSAAPSLSSKAETFGNAAHVWSVFESRRGESDDEPMARGINSFQMLKNRNRWWIVSVLWEYERPDNPIPEEYLD